MDVWFTDWGLNYIVHTMISFGFEGGEYVCLSVETRKEEGEQYSALRGFFRQYELTYILADERDLVRLRTSYRKGEDVYLYRLQVSSRQNLQQIFLSGIDQINALQARPKWYNAMYNNCMTSPFRGARKHAAKDRERWHWSIFLNGYAARHAYDIGLLDSSLPFAELQEKSYVNKKALQIGDAVIFSTQIRHGLPGMNDFSNKGIHHIEQN